ncbi:MAG TPA: mycofactocin-coupled SDR family oxidoreductase [Amycolatopsis sp.]|nr:mycofactocin-coupled SDR family oxidoreductase [Amycolatopsis sp.]
MTGRVRGQVALVTGAARGQGRSHALRLAAEGADIVAVDIGTDIPEASYPMGTRDELDDTVREIQALGRRAVAAPVDVRDHDQLTEVVTDAVGELGRLDIVVANAGIASNGRAHEIDPAIWRAVLGVNLTGVWNTCQVALPHLIHGGRGGSIVITSSAAGLRGYQNLAAYGSAKHAAVGLMRALAVELGPHRIRVNTLHPTQVDTPMIMREDTFRLFAPDLPDPTRDDFAERSQAMHALPVPWIEPLDITEALLFLVSDAGRYLTGTTLPVDAGCLVG